MKRYQYRYMATIFNLFLSATVFAAGEAQHYYLSFVGIETIGDVIRISESIKPMTRKALVMSGHRSYFWIDDFGSIGKFVGSNVS
jgi:hypothetical protein